VRGFDEHGLGLPLIAAVGSAAREHERRWCIARVVLGRAPILRRGGARIARSVEDATLVVVVTRERLGRERHARCGRELDHAIDRCACIDVLAGKEVLLREQVVRVLMRGLDLDHVRQHFNRACGVHLAVGVDRRLPHQRGEPILR
jgi:hypothetical protein